ncbi:MAG: flippase [Patescibacteria group bacterium]|nr:flippase [Patescibacteria group bacterium]
MVQSYSFSKNTLYLMVAYIFQKVLAFFYFIFLARYLGTDGMGKYSFALSFVAIFSVFLDLGFSTVLTRETAKDKDRSSEYLSNSLTFKIILSFLIYFFIIIVINLLGYPVITKQTVYLAALMMILQSLAVTCYSTLRGWQNLKYESLGIIIDQVIYVGLGFLFIFLKFPLPILMLPLILGSIFYLLYPLLVIKKLKIPIRFSLDKKVLSYFFKIALPIVVAIIFSNIFSQINTVLLSFLSEDKFVGLFSTAFRLPQALLFIPLAFGTSTFPAFSYYYAKARDFLDKVFSRVVFYLIIFALPILAAGIILAPQIILLIYGSEFIGSVLSLQILLLALVFMFLDFPFSSLLTAADRQKFNAISRGLALAINILLSFIFIPKLLHLGASLAYAVSFFIFFSLQLVWIRKVVKIDLRYFGKKIFLILLATTLMSFFIFFIKDKMHIIFTIFVGLIFYLLAIYLLKALDKDDLKEIKDLFLKSVMKKEMLVEKTENLE